MFNQIGPFKEPIFPHNLGFFARFTAARSKFEDPWNIDVLWANEIFTAELIFNFFRFLRSSRKSEGKSFVLRIFRCSAI